VRVGLLPYVVGALFLAYRYRWFMDDAYIYMRYADNASILNIGLVFNRGEYVEGFSSPLWMLLWTAVRFLGVGANAFVAVSCVMTLLATLAVLERVNRILVGPGASMHLPLAYLAGNYAVLTYFTSGMENPMIQLVAAGFALYVLEPESRIARGLLVVAPLVRQELALPVALVLACHAAMRKPWLWTCLATGALGGTWLTFRVYYYAALFPNTYYLKDNVDWHRGVAYVQNAFSTYNFGLLALVCLGALVASAVRVRSSGALPLYLRERGVMLAAAGLSTAYVIKIGGDFFHFRYLSFAFIVATCALAGTIEHAAYRLRFATRALPALGLALWAFTVTRFPAQLSHHPIFLHPQEWTRDETLFDAGAHRLREDLRAEDVAKRVNVPLEKAYAQSGRVIHGERASFGGWCAEAYMLYEDHVIHALGLTEPSLAHVAVGSREAGHKWDLVPLAADLLAVRIGTLAPEYESRPVKFPGGPGALRRAVQEGRAAGWIATNLDCLERIETRTFNRHALVENLKLAMAASCTLHP
jgi:hypothetical protein